MKTIKGKTTVELTIEEVNELNALIERNHAKAVRHDDKYDLTYCPICGSVVIKSHLFCPSCGQRLDSENYALQ